MRFLHKYTCIRFVLLLALLAAWAQEGMAQENSTIMEYLVKERPTLAGLVTKAGFAPLLSGNQPVTLLAPPESALQALKQESPEQLRSILSVHVLRGEYLKKDLKEGQTIKAVCGSPITVYRKGGQTLINGVPLQRTDIEAKNGVIHELGGVLAM
ncbi:fasciclin domain-containing protein [Pontibacter mangrovi]|uniref:Fasciclin domain-containing protein n=1 Tax=Pontibacter mangrovi TaxID=2589816 RepID=A0A501W7K7_9BACT|nr:fasciclin domain-containing protein [Pontibacter mangrovi]TPE45569.1 fasciclin domain-containing protein [Pontibacter mangrovi]